MWFKKQKKPFTPLPLDQLHTLTLPEFKKRQQAQEDRLREIQEQSDAQIQAMREQSDAQSRAHRELMRQEREKTEQQIQEIYEQGRAKLAQQQEETANLIKRAFNSPQYIEALSKALAPHIQEEGKHIIEAEILSSEEIIQPKALEQ